MIIVYDISVMVRFVNIKVILNKKKTVKFGMKVY